MQDVESEKLLASKCNFFVFCFYQTLTYRYWKPHVHVFFFFYLKG